MDKRKPFSGFKNEKDLGKDVKFVKDKLFVNGVEYKPTVKVRKGNFLERIWSKKKVSDTDFLDLINQYHIVFLCETWI